MPMFKIVLENAFFFRYNNLEKFCELRDISPSSHSLSKIQKMLVDV